MSVVQNSAAFSTALDQSAKRVEHQFRIRVQRLMSEGMRRMLARTPVNTGEAVMNYVATGGSPSAAPPKRAGDPIEPTNHLAIGSEKLRGAAEQVSRATLAAVDYRDPFKKFFITNRTPHISGLESGALPYAPYTPRSPQGMFGITLVELAQLLQSGKI